MVSEFLEGSEELTNAEIDDTIIDDALRVVRSMWDAGLAHRDIKPANVMLNQWKGRAHRCGIRHRAAESMAASS